MSKLDGSKGHTSIVIELAGQEEPEYQRAYEVDFSDLDIPRDYVIDQIYCGENVTVYAVFEISDEGRKADQHEQNFEDRADYRTYREGSSRNLISDDKICQFQNKVLSKNDIKLPPTESHGVPQIPKEEQNTVEEEKKSDSQALVAPEKVSLGTNTSMAKFTPLLLDKAAGNIEEENQTARNSEGQESQQKEKNKIAILKEIKKLQKKVNSLIRTIECNDFDLDAEDFELSAADSTSFEEAPKSLNLGVKLKPPEKKHKKFDDIPIFSPLTCSAGTKRPLPKQKKSKTNRQSVTPDIPITLMRSISQLSVGSSPTQIIISGEKSDATLRKVSSECSINWQDLEDWKGAGLSKSEVINHVILLDPKYNIMKGVRKSLSLELRNDKLEVICLKKIKNFPFNLEGSLKSKGNNIRILPKREPSLRDNLPLLKREMGDEANKKTKSSKVDLLGIVQVCDKQNALSFEKINLTPNKNLNEDEGDAKLVYPKKNLASPRFPRRNTELEVHFCSATNNTASDGVLKNEKSVSGKKLKVKPLENGADPALKVCSDSEKPTTPVRKSRKATTANSEGKKEAKPIKKSNKKTPRDKEKTEGRDAPSQEPVKTRPVASSSRHSSRSHTESKVHVDRSGKSDVSNNHKTSHSAKQNFEEKPTCKVDRLPRLISQKKEVSEPPNDCVESREKDGKTLKKNSVAVNLSHKKSVSDITNEKPETSPAEYVPEKCLHEEKGSEQRPPVMLELFSEKPQSGKMVSSEGYNKHSKSKQNAEDVVTASRESNKEEESNGGDSDEFKKPVVKSLWALTKLILFEDGTQKLEILEASLNPPEWV